uniref:KIAA0319-like n=1 Tax=Xiphophorus couchianus TaxID=32473 RepID=A0A3B5MV52_9TELE
MTFDPLPPPPPGQAAALCRVSGGVLGIHWSSTLSLGWFPLASGQGGATCFETCCLRPGCGAVWSVGGRCVLLGCSRTDGCGISALPQPHQESLGLLQLLAKVALVLSLRAGRKLLECGAALRGSANRKNRVISSCEPSKYLETRNNQLQSEQTPPSHRFMELTEHAAINPSLNTFNFWEFQENKIVISCAFPEGQRTHRAAHWSCSPPAVRELVVSAGQSVEVTLPRNEVELNAYVVPTPQPGSSYAFDWRLKTHPRNYTGEMEGQKGQTLKLSKLTVGLYEFEVTVMDGDGARGRGYVNVTVRPEPRVNKPPVAMVSPKYQEISLPTSSTVIDGSQSTDDDKVVTWHWEEVKGPLREEKVSADTPILTLTNLVPGNYTFSLTVTDSDGATDSTQASLSVNKAKDYKPVANAGPNQAIQLPRNSITLYGNQSTDDHDNLGYEWSLSPESKDKVVEMQGVRTPILQLSAMQEGDYTFQLTVTDSAGQQDTSKVTVIVQPGQNRLSMFHGSRTFLLVGLPINTAESIHTLQFLTIWSNKRKMRHLKLVLVVLLGSNGSAGSAAENNQPPVADAGPEKELTLPVDETTLDGTESKDDQKIASYLWTKTRSVLGLVLEINNADKAVATVMGLEVGEYHFTLTVTDDRKLESSDTVKVIVREGQWAVLDRVSEPIRSVLYVTIASFLIVVAVATLIWSMVCCCNRRRNKVRRSKSRYKILEARLKPAPGPASSALMHSDSDLDSDEGQERGHLLRPQNGSLNNGQGPPRAKKPREELL